MRNKKVDEIEREVAELMVYDAIYHNPNCFLSRGLKDKYDFDIPLTPRGNLPYSLWKAMDRLEREGYIDFDNDGWTVCEPKEEIMKNEIDIEVAELLVYDAVYHFPNSLFSGDLKEKYDFGLPLNEYGSPPLIIFTARANLERGGFIHFFNGWVVSDQKNKDQDREEDRLQKEAHARRVAYDRKVKKEDRIKNSIRLKIKTLFGFTEEEMLFMENTNLAPIMTHYMKGI